MRYAVPDDIGGLRDIPHSVIGVSGFQASEFGGYIRKPNGSFTQGYRAGAYFDINIKHKLHKVHILTTYAWYGEKPCENAQSNHIRGAWNGPANAEDLEWTTPRQNNKHAIATGLNPIFRSIVRTFEDGTQQKFQSTNEAVTSLRVKGISVNRKYIVEACNGKREMYTGTTWKYADGGASRKRKFIDSNPD